MMLFLWSLLFCSPTRVNMSGNIGSHLPWCNTLWAIEYVLICCHQLGRFSCEACLSWWSTYCLHYPALICLYHWCHRDIIMGDMVWCSRITNPCVFCEQVEGFSVSSTKYTSFLGLLNILCTTLINSLFWFFIFLFFIFLYVTISILCLSYHIDSKYCQNFSFYNHFLS